MAIKRYLTDFEAPTKNEKQETNGHGTCFVNGCLWEGHINQDGQWMCRYHSLRSPGDWAKVTSILRNHENELAWCEYVSTFTSTDYIVSKTHGKAPSRLAAGQLEGYIHYKKRMARYALELFGLPNYQSDRKLKAPAMFQHIKNIMCNLYQP